MKIGIYAEEGHPDSKHFHGVSNTLKYLVKYSKERNIDLDIITYNEKNKIAKDGSVTIYGYKPRIPVELYPKINQDPLVLFGNKGMDSKIISQGIAREYDVISIVGPGAMAWQGLKIAEDLKSPVVAIWTTDIPRYFSAELKRVPESLAYHAEELGWWYVKHFYNKDKASLVLAPTKQVEKELKKRLNSNIKILGRGVDTNLFTPGPNNKEPVLFYSGRIDIGQKNLMKLIEIQDRLPNAKIRVAGDGPDLKNLKLMLKNAEFTGKLKGKKLAEAYNTSDIFIFPSMYDTFGQVVQEALASGLPCVVTDKGGPQEIIKEGVTGFISSEKSFVNNVLKLYKNKSLREKMSINARKFAETKSWDNIFDSLMMHYNSVIK